MYKCDHNMCAIACDTVRQNMCAITIYVCDCVRYGVACACL